MTLAEIFLLLLIVGWYGMRLESEDASAEPPSPAAVLQEDLRSAQEELQKSEQAREEAEMKLKEYERILQWLQDVLGLPSPPQNTEDAERALTDRDERMRDEARRGKPRCASTNVLVEIVADSDVVSLVVLENFEAADQRFPTGLTLTDEAQIEQFLMAVESYYSGRRESQRECAYDYRLLWRTDRDYRAARQRFEGYFYPAGVRQLQ